MRQLSKNIILLVILLQISSASPSTNATRLTDDILAHKPTCQLRLGWGEWPPYQSLGYNDEPYGIQIDLIKEIAKEANCTLTFHLQTFNENQIGIKNGTIDFTLDTTITPERQQFAHFSAPYRNEVMVLYVRPGFEQACLLNNIDATLRNGFRLGVTRGNFYGYIIEKVKIDPELSRLLIYSEKDIEHFTLIKRNKIDGFFEDPAVLGFKMRMDPQIGPLTACKTSVITSPVSLMFSKKTVSLEVVASFNAAIEKIRDTPDYLKNWAW